MRGVLFDLDGTFADTAPDLARAINSMRSARGLPPLPIGATRPVTSTGARGMLGVGLGITPDHAEYMTLREEFLRIYAENLCRETTLFPGMAELLEHIESRGWKWGIVTNKAERLAKPLIELLGLATRCACVIGGDSTAHTKPHPDPLFAACRQIAIAPDACTYIGDDRRDVEAGRAAGMKTIAVRYGYLNGEEPNDWGADAVVDCPHDVIPHL